MHGIFHVISLSQDSDISGFVEFDLYFDYNYKDLKIGCINYLSILLI